MQRIKQKAPIPENCLYYQVQLGFVKVGTQSRWLINKEISAGVIETIKKKEQVLVIGQLELWKGRL
ncbi:hypothetical protein MM221_11785 [Salipaludibacillus sp. LMS25]|uniref:hypothetical protein n=1 Tax=Salipaludibacillus sp. LMS25 TaxID=2924031 RepID=UPI0020D06495|nr:hypothetical protein [Salipaludibacillus sp. LMS25]UTR13324.1 hypothetical protein MM221_11785 [Salipaludibacillus sp. LMS25]